ncbi:MAG: hypothetical protein QOJ80_6315 [Mycobacterium sp.]|nr:hypothetical protein [Mycobacterium sp.]
MEQPIRSAVIIGAGHNGLVTASYLAEQGLEVIIVERATTPGGAVATDDLFNGYRASPGAMQLYLLQSKVVEELDLLEHGLQIAPMDPAYVTPFEDGRVLIQWRDPTLTRQEVAKFSKHDADNFPRWVDFWRCVGEIFDPYTLDHEPPTIAKLASGLQGTPHGDVLDVLINWSIRRFMSHYFENEQVQAALMPNSDTKSLDEPGELLGWAMTSPNRGARPEHQGLPIGGMGQVSEALAKAARSRGVEIRVNAEVSRILLKEGRACGVELLDGTTMFSDIVVSNADPKHTFGKLIRDDLQHIDLRQRVDQLDTESGSLKFHAAVDELPDFTRYFGEGHDPHLLGMIRIAPSVSYIEKSLSDAASGRATDSPILIVQIPTVYDSTAAPRGKHLVSIRVKFEPSKLREGSWSELREVLTQQIIDTMTQYAPNFRRSIRDCHLSTPDDIAARTGMTDACIHHINHTATSAMGSRLFPGGGYATPIPGLVMCGAGTHPGGDVTGAPGRNAASFILSTLVTESTTPRAGNTSD